MADTAWAVRWRCRIFVSHDREFVSGLATRVIEVRTDGTLTDDLGTYDEYLQSQRIDG